MSSVLGHRDLLAHADVHRTADLISAHLSTFADGPHCSCAPPRESSGVVLSGRGASS